MVVIQLSSTEPHALAKAASDAGKGGKVALIPKPSDHFEDVENSLILAGFINITRAADGTVTASLPDYQAGHKLSLNEKPKPTSSGWGVALDADAPLIDEDELLERDGIAAGTGAASAECAPDATGKRKPCKDCSCGLADELEAEKGGVEVRKAPPADKSACGNCSLGDAFRCGGCPYLGLPPFKPGEKVALPTSLMTSDI